MPTLAIARLHDVKMGPEIATYLMNIDATLPAYGGRFLVHGGRYDLIEGDWTGDLVIMEFPDRQNADAWYASEPYREILPLRAENARCDVIMVETVAPGYLAASFLKPTA